MGRIGGLLGVTGAIAMLATPVLARDALGIFGEWGAFRDVRPLRCFAIAEPARGHSDAEWRPFASIATWPGPRVRGQLHIRLRKARAAGARIELWVGDRRFELVGGGADAWAANPRADAIIVTAMRNASIMSVATKAAANDRRFTDTYNLRGAATAIDAAALGCARLR